MPIRPVPDDGVRQFDDAFARLPDYSPDACPVRSALAAISDDKWKIPIVMKLARYGTLRFRELLRALPRVRPKALTKALRSLEAEAFVTREVFGDVPSRVEYALTPSAIAFVPLLFQVQDWAVRTRAMPETVRDGLRAVSAEQRSAAAPASACRLFP